MHGERGDNVVCLKPLDFFAHDVEGLGGRAGQGDLRAQVLWHGLAVGFVLIVKVIAEGVAAFVEDHCDMCHVTAGVSFDVAVEHIAKARDRPDWQAI